MPNSDRPGESFAALFEQSAATQGLPRRRAPRVGETVDALVVQVGKDAVFVELDGRHQAFLELADVRAPDGTVKVAVGDRLRARVAASDAEQGIRLVPTVDAAATLGASVPVGGAAPGGGDAEGVRIAVGQVVGGAVDRVESYGVFLQIDGTRGRAGRGLVPAAELGTPRGADLRKHFPVGTKLRAKVLDIAEDGKIRLSVRALKDDEERANFDGFKDNEKAAEPRGFGTLGDLLKGRKGR